MDVANQVKNIFYPDQYSTNLPISGSLELCLLRKKGFGGYCIAVFSLDTSIDIEQQIEKAREKIRQSTGAMWLIKEVGVYIIFHTRADISTIISSELKIDKTGFHAVIIQGVYVINGQKKHIYNHSKWFEHSFGNSELIMKKLRNISF